MTFTQLATDSLMTAQSTLAIIGPIGWQEMIIVGIIGVLLFGKRLPEVGRNLGRSFVEFKKGLTGAADEAKQTADEAARIAREADESLKQTNKTEEVSQSA